MYLTYSFEDIMAYHPDNIYVYNEIKENLSNLVPFVGAGLTQFAYHSWNGALMELAGKITNKTDSRHVKELIKSRNYMDAAQQLEDLRTPSNLARDIAHLFSANHLTAKIDELPKEAVSLLPLLFKGLVLTTNFDETLETVYKEYGHQFQRVSDPVHQELLEQFLRNQNICGLFKMHGTVTGNLIEYGNIVFTSVQYDLHYKKGSSLISALKACFEKRLMFFLGCSLEDDRTMDILKEVIVQGVNHYTIIECKKSKKDEKIRELGDKSIRAILYEQGRHEAVRVILEHLLEETDPNTYQKIRPVGALKSLAPSDRFSYNAGIVPLSGRKEEIGELNSFLQDTSIPFQWWAITGPGGCGKSRLAYEFQNRLPTGWLARYLRHSDYQNLYGMTAQLTQKTLLIADYVQEHARELGKWMESLTEQARSLPIRLLLVERETDRDYQDSAWTKHLYSDVHDGNKLKKTCYHETFLNLPPLSDHDLLDIIGNYATALQGDKPKETRVLTYKIKQMLLQKLKAIDPGLCRPLYAMFLTDAYMDNNDPEQWKTEDILSYVISREKKRLTFCIRNVMHTDITDQNLYDACVYLQCISTALQDVCVENLQELFPDIWRVIEYNSICFVSPKDFLSQIGLVVKDELPALRPDLVGEYFVYDWLFKNSEKEIKNFIFTIWKFPIPTQIFFGRMINDFGHLLNAFPERWDILFPNNIPFPKSSISIYAILVSNATFYCNAVAQCERLVDLLEDFSSSYPDILEIAVLFANGLVNLSYKQNKQGRERTVERLEKLYSRLPNVPEIAVSFSKGLVNLSYEQDEKDMEKTVEYLKKLNSKLPDIPEIVVSVSKGLINLNRGQDKIHKEQMHVNPDYIAKVINNLKNFANEIDDKSKTAQSKEDINDGINFDEKYMHINALLEIANIVLSNGATAFSTFFDTKVEVGLPRLFVHKNINEFQNFIDNQNYNILIEFNKSISGVIILKPKENFITEVQNILIGYGLLSPGYTPLHANRSVKEIFYSILHETGNIFSGACVTGLSEIHNNLGIRISDIRINDDVKKSIIKNYNEIFSVKLSDKKCNFYDSYLILDLENIQSIFKNFENII